MHDYVHHRSVFHRRKSCGLRTKVQANPQILHDAGPVNAGMAETGENLANGMDIERWLARSSDDTIICNGVSSREKVRRVLEQLKAQDWAFR